MYVCLCKGVTCGAIRAAINEQGLGSLRELSLSLGVATQCGKCANAARQVLDDTLADCPADGCCGGSEDEAA